MARRMLALLVTTMASSLFTIGSALSSHFDSDGAALSELSWSSSLAVVGLSLSVLFTLVFLMLACVCCKKGHAGFKEFENADGEEYQGGVSTLASPASQGAGPEVYILPLTQVTLPVAKQPARSVQLLKSSDVSRHSLLYLKEIGDGWFGKVLLGEVNTGLSSTQVVVRELKASASVQDQTLFLQEALPYRTLQHPALLRCLAQYTEVTPYLLLMDFCPLGDVKGYLRSCRAADTLTPDPLVLQRMACDIASGLLHLHKHSFTHGDLALRNCLLAADITVKIGDYGLSHNKYKDDYYVTSDQMYVPLRWMAPELLEEVHGNLLVADQTQQSNIWSLGVTVWELLELGNQPYRHYSDRQVLSYASRGQQLRLPKPLLKVPLAERWYEVMQFCWLPAEQRPNAEEVQLLLSYLCARGASEAEDDFERRWNSLRPASSSSCSAPPGPEHASSSCSSSFPLLERFSSADGYHSESGDDILTVTETSHGLNFEYRWEQARAERPYHAAASGTLGQGNPHCQDMYYPPGGMAGGCPADTLSEGVSPAYYQPSKQLCGTAPTVVPVLSARSPSAGSEYYIRIEEPADCGLELDYTMCSYSPDYQGGGGSGGSFLTGSADSSHDCATCPSQAKRDCYWLTDHHKASAEAAYDSSDASPAISLTMEPLLGQVPDGSPLRAWESGHYVSYKERDGGYYYQHSPASMGLEEGGYVGPPPEAQQESWGSRSLRAALGELENPLGIVAHHHHHHHSVGSAPPGYGDAYLESSHHHHHHRGASVIGKNATGGYYDMMGSLRKTMPGHGHHCVRIDMESEGAIFIGHHRDSDSEEEEEEEEDIFVERQSCGTWPARRSAHHRSSGSHHRRSSCRQDSYADFHYTMPSTDIEDCWPEDHGHGLAFHSAPKPLSYLQASADDPLPSKHATLTPVGDADAYIYLCHEGDPEAGLSPDESCHPHFMDPLTGLLVRSYGRGDYVTDKIVEIPSIVDDGGSQSPAPGGPVVSKAPQTTTAAATTPPFDYADQYVDIAIDDAGTTLLEEEAMKYDLVVDDLKEPEFAEASIADVTPPLVEAPVPLATAEPDSELSQAADSGVERGSSSVSLVDILDCSDGDEEDDDDVTDVTSGIFADEAGDLNASPALKALQQQLDTPDSVDSMDLPSGAGSCGGLSPASSHISSSPKAAADSGYDTENNESPEFVLKEPHESRETLGKPTLDSSLEEEEEEEGEEEQTEARQEGEEGEQEAEVVPLKNEDVVVTASQTGDHMLAPLSGKDPYRDSAYFSDYENERPSRDEGEESLKKSGEGEDTGEEAMEEGRPTEKKEKQSEEGEGPATLPEKSEAVDLEEENTSSVEAELSRHLWPSSAPVLSTLASPLPEMKGCLMEECVQGDLLGLPIKEAECSISMEDAGLEEWPAQEDSSSLGDWAAEVVGAMEEALGALSEDRRIGSTSQEQKEEDEDEGEEEEEEEEEEEDKRCRTDNFDEALESTEVPDNKIRHVISSSEIPCDIAETSQREKNNFKQTRHSSPPPPPSSSPPLPRSAAERGEDADEEDGDTDDSGSDEELCGYIVRVRQSGEEESEEEAECHPVPIVVSDCSDAHNLRSLLKLPASLTDAAQDERQKKVVSFFDDVTVYLFDQESPTKELVEHGFSPGMKGAGQAAWGSSAPQEKATTHASDDSSDGNVSEESAGYEWDDDDFPLLPLPTSKMADSDSPPSSASLAHKAASRPATKATRTSEPKPAVQYSRFTVSPSALSRFSITHVTDSDMESAGGSSEDGERE